MSLGSKYLIEIEALRGLVSAICVQFPWNIRTMLVKYGLGEYFQRQMRELRHGCIGEMLTATNWSTRPKLKRGEITSELERAYLKLNSLFASHLGVNAGEGLQMFDLERVPIKRLRHLAYFPSYERIARLPLDVRRVIADYVGAYAREIAAALRILRCENEDNDLFWDAIDKDVPKDAARMIVRYQMGLLDTYMDVCAVAVGAMTPI